MRLHGDEACRFITRKLNTQPAQLLIPLVVAPFNSSPSSGGLKRKQANTMFGQKTQRSYPILGQMTYRSQYWFGTLALPEFEAEVEILVRANKDGISDAQLSAVQACFNQLAQIKAQASAAMLSLFAECDMPVPDTDIWVDLLADSIEVTDENYDASTGKISVLLLFASQSIAEFCPAIEVTDGVFVQVLSAT